VIRSYLPKDEQHLYMVCLKTGDSGNDGSHLFLNPSVLGERYVGPYIHMQPELSFVLVDSLGVCGYVLGALDSTTFYQRYFNEWIPKMKKKYPESEKELSIKENKKDFELIQHFHNPGNAIDINNPMFVEYPSHLHIDLLARAQGMALGHHMMETLLENLKNKGSKGVWLEMSPTNFRALKFYSKIGFKKLKETEEDLILGMKFEQK